MLKSTKLILKNMKKIIIGAIIFLMALLFLFLINNKTEKNTEEIKKEEVVINKNMQYIITLQTNKGDIKFETYQEDAPNTVKNFIELAKKGFYDGVIFHRVIEGFMIQGGDPTGTGMGGPGYAFEDEIDANSKIYKEGYHKGVVAMANAGPNTQGSQFFIMVADYPLPPLYTIFGNVIEGQEVADAISLVEKSVNDKPLEDVIINNIIIKEN